MSAGGQRFPADIATDATRWGAGIRTTSVHDARARVVAAALACYRRQGVKKTSIADIASQASITRQTVYRYFENHEEIVSAAVSGELIKEWGRICNSIKTAQAESGVALFMAFYRRLRDNAGAGDFLYSEEVSPFLICVATGERSFLEVQATTLATCCEESSGAESKDILTLTALAEVINRFIFSYVHYPSPFYHSENILREVIENIILNSVPKIATTSHCTP